MAAAALKADALLPQAAGGLAPGAAVSLAVHVGLIVALTFGIDWRSRPPEVMAAELWAAVPQTAAPPPPPVPVVAPTPTPPPPPVARTETPPEVEIALERERRQKAEQKKAEEKRGEEKKAETERRKKEQAEAAREAEEKAEQERIDRQRVENLRRMMAQAGSGPTSGSTGTASQTAAPSANYLGKVRAAVRANLVFTGTVPGNAAAEVEVNIAPGGTVISRRVAKSSGSKAWDDAVLQAIDKTASFPRDTDGRVPPSFTLVFRQND